MNAAEWAPSAMNLQECHITLVSEKNAVDALAKAVTENLDEAIIERLKPRFPEGHEVNAFYSAPAVYVLSAENPQDHYTKVDIGITLQSICVAAKSFGIDTCIIGLAGMLFEKCPHHEALKALQIPSAYTPVIAVVAGYGPEQPAPPPRKENRSNRIV